MVTLTVTIDEELHEVIRIAAKLADVSVEDYLRVLMEHSIDDIKARMDDPVIGMIEGGRSDLSERDEELLQRGWQPD
jgi:hypothetical protein